MSPELIHRFGNKSLILLDAFTYLALATMSTVVCGIINF